MSGPRPWPVDGAPWTPGRRRPEVETAKEDSSHSAAWPVGGARGPGGRGRALASWRGSMGPRIGAGSCASDWTRTAAVVDGLCISCDVDGQRVPDHRKGEKSPTTTRDHRLGSKPPGGTGQLAGPAATGPGPQNLPVGGTGGAPWLGARGRSRRTRQLAGHGGSRARWEGARPCRRWKGLGWLGWDGPKYIRGYVHVYPPPYIHPPTPMSAPAYISLHHPSVVDHPSSARDPRRLPGPRTATVMPPSARARPGAVEGVGGPPGGYSPVGAGAGGQGGEGAPARGRTGPW